MAGVGLKAAKAGIATGTAVKTLIQLVAAANQRVLCKGWSISFDGVTASAVPVLVQLVRQTSAGTMSALTPSKLNESDAETLQTTFQHTATGAEPTTTYVLETHKVRPDGGNFDVYYPAGQEVTVKGGNRLAIVVTAPANVNADVGMSAEE